MYLPESHAQMFDILAELRIYAAANGLPQLAEQLDDALMLLAAEGELGVGSEPSAPALQDNL